MAGERLLSIAFDPALLLSREVLLREAGYMATSVLGSEAGKAAASSDFDIFMVGHTAPYRERVELVQWLKANFPATPVIALRRHMLEQAIPGADCGTDVDNPPEWLKAIDDCIAASTPGPARPRPFDSR